MMHRYLCAAAPEKGNGPDREGGPRPPHDFIYYGGGVRWPTPFRPAPGSVR